MVSEIFPVVASDTLEEKWVTERIEPQSIAKHDKQTAATGLFHYSEVHIARLGDLFKETSKAIHTTIS